MINPHRGVDGEVGLDAGHLRLDRQVRGRKGLVSRIYRLKLRTFINEVIRSHTTSQLT
jgi:hypothetical protein